MFARPAPQLSVPTGTLHVDAVDDVEELFHHGNLFEHKLHFPVNILLKQMNIRKLSIQNKYAESQF